jgi:hypothetical protein
MNSTNPINAARADDVLTTPHHKQRLQRMLKQAVIDLGYLENLVEKSPSYGQAERMIMLCLDAIIDEITNKNARAQRTPDDTD